jgi:hypothetical protein
MSESEEKGCSIRVPDNNDFVNCGRTVLRGGLCAQHLFEESIRLRNKIRELTLTIKKLQERLDELQTESG